MSSLQSINSFNLESDLVQKFLKDYTVLAKNGNNIILCWIPSHVGILGNEKADAAAKSALSLPVTRMKLPATGMYPRITKLIFDEWQEVWDYKLPQWGLGQSPSRNRFLVHFSPKIRHLVAKILMIFLRINLPNFMYFEVYQTSTGGDGNCFLSMPIILQVMQNN